MGKNGILKFVLLIVAYTMVADQSSSLEGFYNSVSNPLNNFQEADCPHVQDHTSFWCDLYTRNQESASRWLILPPFTHKTLGLAKKHLELQEQLRLVYEQDVLDRMHRIFMVYCSGAVTRGIEVIVLLEDLMHKTHDMILNCMSWTNTEFMQQIFWWLRCSYDKKSGMFCQRYTYDDMPGIDWIKKVLCYQDKKFGFDLPVCLWDEIPHFSNMESAIGGIRGHVEALEKIQHKLPSVLSNWEGGPREKALSWMVFLCRMYGMSEAQGVVIASTHFHYFRQTLVKSDAFKRCLEVSVGPKIFALMWGAVPLPKERLDNRQMALERCADHGHFDIQPLIRGAIYMGRMYPCMAKKIQKINDFRASQWKITFLFNMDVLDDALQYNQINLSAECVLGLPIPWDITWLGVNFLEEEALPDWCAESGAQHVFYRGFRTSVAEELRSIALVDDKKLAYMHLYIKLIKPFLNKDVPRPPLRYLGALLTKNIVKNYCYALYHMMPPSVQPSCEDIHHCGISDQDLVYITDNKGLQTCPIEIIDGEPFKDFANRFGHKVDREGWVVENLFVILRGQEHRDFLRAWKNVQRAIIDSYRGVRRVNIMMQPERFLSEGPTVREYKHCSEACGEPRKAGVSLESAQWGAR